MGGTRNFNVVFIYIAVLMRLKKKKAFRGCVINSDADRLLSTADWLSLFRETCLGLLKLGTATCHYQLTHFIYCGAITARFTGDLEKVSWALSLHGDMAEGNCDCWIVGSLT